MKLSAKLPVGRVHVEYLLERAIDSVGQIAMHEAGALDNHLLALRERWAVARKARGVGELLRDQIDLLRRDVRVMEQPDADAPQASYLKRQEPGKMGLGTNQSSYVPPPGWIPPKKPDPMTTGHSKGGRRIK